jgi:hypothetical protein
MRERIARHAKIAPFHLTGQARTPARSFVQVRPIDPTLVDEVWREIISYPADRIESETQSFLAQSAPRGRVRPGRCHAAAGKAEQPSAAFRLS